MAEEVKSYSQMRREFYDKFQNKIVPLVLMHENSRQLRLIIAVILSSILAAAATVLIVIAFNHGGLTKSNEGIVKLAGILYGLSYFVWYSIKKNFENSIKKKIMPTICKCFGDMQWSNGYYCNADIFTESCIIPAYNNSEYDDIFKGSYKDVSIEIVEAEYIQGSGKHRHTVFNGVIVKLDMNKNFVSHTLVKSSSIVRILPKNIFGNNLRFTELEDPEFNKKFDVFTTDEVDARYLLTPSFMERLKKMKTAFRASKVECAFYKNDLLIALHTREDLFSLCSLVKRIDDNRQFFRMYEQIVSIIKLIDHFKLDQRIGL